MGPWRIFISALVGVVTIASAVAADPLALPSLSSDAWLRTGPSTSHARITGIPRGTAVVELADPDSAFRAYDRRWVRVYVLEGRAKGREGWVWGRFITCCVQRDWVASAS